ncbi:MAG: hypothetical protein BWY78_01394 [Alphaproteobacteria bacterium ADurb.Bin438]|nr:MAG: hypothetical protein BWY78_01394 [Alphaproteobacteria bacterium ADurb.Bin438]
MENIVKDIPSNKLVLITHAPPYNTDCDYTKLKDGGFAHVGSKAIYKIIENKQPILTLHGHIHDTVQVTGNFPCEIGKTISCAVSSDHIGDNPYVVNASINDGVVFVERVKL